MAGIAIENLSNIVWADMTTDAVFKLDFKIALLVAIKALIHRTENLTGGELIAMPHATMAIAAIHITSAFLNPINEKFVGST